MSKGVVMRVVLGVLLVALGAHPGGGLAMVLHHDEARRGAVSSSTNRRAAPASESR
jgi:hypothetical protein